LKARGDAKKSTTAVQKATDEIDDELNHVDAGAEIDEADALKRTQDPEAVDHKPESAVTLVAKPPQPRVYVDTMLLLVDETQPNDEGRVTPFEVELDNIST